MKRNKLIGALAVLAITATIGAVATVNFSDGVFVSATEENSVVLEEGASVRKTGRYENGAYGEATAAIRFSAAVTDTEKDYGMIIVPKSYVEALGESTDYYGGLVGADKTYVLYEYKDASDIGYGVDNSGNLTATRMIRGSLDQVKFDNINKEFMAIVYEDTGTEKLYDTVNLSNARSVAYVSTAALNAGETGDILLTNVKNAGYDLLGVDFADETYTLGDTTYESYEEMAAALDYTDAFEFTKKGKVFKVGDASALATDNMQKIAMKWVSSNTDVATVDEDGDLLAKAAGKTTVTAYVGASLETAIFKTSCTVDVYSEADYGKIVAPLNAEGSDIETRIYYDNAIGGEIAFDETMGAYKYTYKEGASDSWYDHGVGFMTDSEEFKRYAAGRYVYPYMAIDFCFEGTNGKPGTDFNYMSLQVRTGGDVNSTVAGKDYFRLDYSEIKFYDQNGTEVKYDNMVTGQWYTLYAPMVDGYDLTTGFARLFVSTPFKKEDGSVTNYWIRNMRFSALPVALKDGKTYGATEENVGQFAGYGWELTKAPAGVHVIAGNQISMTVVGEYTATNGTSTVNFTILPADEYAALTETLLDAGDGSVNSFKTRWDTWATVVYDDTMNAYKVTQAVASGMGDDHGMLCVNSSSAMFTKYQENYMNYKYIAFDLCVDGVYGVDYSSFSFYMNGYSNGIGLASTYVLVKDMDGNSVEKANMQKGVWYTVYVPISNQMSQQWAEYVFMTQNSKNTDENGYKVYVPYWIKNIRFDTKTA